MTNLLFLMVKPWSLHHAGDVLIEFDKAGKRLREAYIEKMPLEFIAKHYEDHKDRHYFNPMILDHQDKSSLIAVYRGSLDNMLAIKEKIRKRFSYDISPHPDYKRDAIHTSRNDFEFVNELIIWGSYLR